MKNVFFGCCVAAVVWSGGYVPTVDAFLLDAMWAEEHEVDYPVSTEQGECLLGKTTVMRHLQTREWRGLFTPFDTDLVALTGGVKPELEGDGYTKIVRLEPGALEGTYVDFTPIFEQRRCLGFTLVLYDEQDHELGRQVVYKDGFENYVSDADLPATAGCRQERVSAIALGVWTDFSCDGSVINLFEFSPFDRQEVLVKVWQEQVSERRDDLQVHFALKTRSERWAKAKMVNDHQLQWESLRDADDRVVAFEVTLRDGEGHAVLRRIYKKP